MIPLNCVESFIETFHYICIQAQTSTYKMYKQMLVIFADERLNQYINELDCNERRNFIAAKSIYCWYCMNDYHHLGSKILPNFFPDFVVLIKQSAALYLARCVHFILLYLALQEGSVLALKPFIWG